MDQEHLLSEQDKLLILLSACSLFMITLIGTICFVSPCCCMYKMFMRFLQRKQSNALSEKSAKMIYKGKTDINVHLQPQFLERHSLGDGLAKVPNSLLAGFTSLTKEKRKNGGENKPIPPPDQLIHLYSVETEEELRTQKRLLKQLFKRRAEQDSLILGQQQLVDHDYYASRSMSSKNKIMLLPEPEVETNAPELVLCVQLLPASDVTIGGQSLSLLRLALSNAELRSFKHPKAGPEMNVYLNCVGQASGSHFTRKSSSRKLSNRLANCVKHRTCSVRLKNELSSYCIPLDYQSEPLAANVLKETKLRIRLMQELKHANDHCLGELSIQLKHFLHDNGSCDSNCEQQRNEEEMGNKCYKLNKPKDVKGDLLFGTCYLPTSKRITFIIVKGSLFSQCSEEKQYYVRVLMFFNAKLVKKKKTSVSSKLLWPENETITFDLSNFNESKDELAFLIVLCAIDQGVCKSISSPSSPESPVELISQQLISDSSKNATFNSSSNFEQKLDEPIGHFIIDTSFWREMRQNPRKQIIRLARLH